MEIVFEVNRYNPETEEGNFYQEFSFPVDHGELEELTVLESLIKLKEEKDGSLTFRHSCGHGSCGSCAMLINGENRLACKTHLIDLVSENETRIKVSPLPGFPVIKDLVVELESFFDQDEEVKPYLIAENGSETEEERLQTPEELGQIQEATECIMCGACTSACPTYWDNKKYLGPGAFVKAFRWERDSRDEGGEERMDFLDDSRGGVWGCNKVFNCEEACPKDIDTVGIIDLLKREALGF
ncbi:succinate dehydrogenase iron-sulfur subunit [Candidatus Bipolaricaulota bacterium]|nr:succinate dehydrogenase iron-sulfur subunit [Candidatus Bipolaricaulota bacterium]MCF7889883.1 succinate dehydrogenase iron-sulfur subunit [Candidatus Bipolaricaulota bacterium]